MVHGDMKTTAGGQVWQDWQKHSSSTRSDTLLTLVDSLRRNYPDFVVTVAQESAGLIDFAEANNAEAVLHGGNEQFISERVYSTKSRRSGVAAGQLIDDVKFGSYGYKWNDEEFPVIHAEWVDDSLFANRHSYYFILYERSKLANTETRPLPVDQLIAAATKWNKDLHEEVWVFHQETWAKSSKLWKSVEQSKWDDVILDPVMKKALIDDVEGFFDNEAEYREFAVPFKRGIILHGAPGNGKSLSIKALMNSLASRPDPIPTLYVKSFAGCHDETYAIREVFLKARDTTPCLLIFEDLDSLVKEKVRSFFLNEVDGLEDNDGLMIIGSTNYLEKLDPSITKRPSRFDRKYHFALPAYSERVLYADYWKGKLAKNQKVDFSEGLANAIAGITDGFSFAYLKEAFITSLLAIVGAKRAGLEEPEGLAKVKSVTNCEANGHSVDGAEPYEEALLWRVIQKQVNVLRVEMEDARKSIEEAELKEAEKEKKEDKTDGDAEDSDDEAGCRC